MLQNTLIFRCMMQLSALVILLVACVPSNSTSNFVVVTQSVTHQGSAESPSTSTPSPVATPSQTQIAFDEDVYNATQSVVQTKVAQFPRECEDDYSRPKFSPNGVWMVELCYSENDRDLVMTLSNGNAQVLWKLLYQDYLPSTDFIPDGGMSVVHWSQDERYVHFNSFINSSGGECFRSSGVADSGMGLFRLDLNTGAVTTILPPTNTYWWYRFSFSPMDRRLVYAARGRDLKIFDIPTGQVISVVHASNFHEGGGYIWSPDGLQFVYSTVISGDQGAWYIYSVRLVDAKSGNEQVLLESPDDCFAAISWTEDNILTLEKNYSEALIEFDLTLNKIISEATMTPYP